MLPFRLLTPLVLLTVCVASAFQAAPAPQQAPGGPAPYTLLAREGRRPLPVRIANGQEMFSLNDLASIFGLTWREDPVASGLVITATSRNQSVLLSLTQGLASVSGRLFSLPAPPARDGARGWNVPVDFVGRVLPAITGTRIDLRKPSRLIVLGDLRVPRLAARHELLGTLARVTFDVAPPAPHTVSQENGRIVVQFDADALDTTLPGVVNGEIVAAVRPGERPTVIVIEPGPKFASFRASDVPSPQTASGRLVIDVMAQVGTPPPAATATEPPPLLDLPAAPGLRTVIIDPGHGGDESGAKGPQGVLEKDVTLAVGRRLKAALEARLGVRALLTRDIDRTMTLDERAALANNNKADLFISLHANASLRTGTSGAEVFFLSLDEYGAEAARASHPEGELLPVFGGGSRDIQLILWEMAQARYIEQSAALARLVEAELRQRVPMSARAIQQAPFRVLVGANMPAVLVELAFITNPEQEKALSSDGFQQQLVLGLVSSVVRYRDEVVGSAPAGTAAPVR